MDEDSLPLWSAPARSSIGGRDCDQFEPWPEIPLEFVVFTQECFQWQRIAGEAATMRRLGMTFRAIGEALGVDEKTVRKALGRRATEG